VAFRSPVIAAKAIVLNLLSVGAAYGVLVLVFQHGYGKDLLGFSSTAGIDPVARRQLWDLLFQLSGRGITFFVTTHYMDEAERCSHLAYIYYGELIADGTPDSLRALPEVNPPGTHRFEISAPAITTALRKAKEMTLFKSATIFGRSIHALVDETVGREELDRELRRRNIDVEEIRPLVPTLEDAFVELSQRRQEQMEAAS